MPVAPCGRTAFPNTCRVGRPRGQSRVRRRGRGHAPSRRTRQNAAAGCGSGDWRRRRIRRWQEIRNVVEGQEVSATHWQLHATAVTRSTCHEGRDRTLCLSACRTANMCALHSTRLQIHENNGCTATGAPPPSACQCVARSLCHWHWHEPSRRASRGVDSTYIDCALQTAHDEMTSLRESELIKACHLAACARGARLRPCHFQPPPRPLAARRVAHRATHPTPRSAENLQLQ